MKNAVITTHKLDFEAAPWYDPDFVRFRVGTCKGLYMPAKSFLGLLAIENESPGNGHLTDVFEWFEYSAKTNKIPLQVMECMNKRFKRHLIDKRGFKEIKGTDHVEKKFK